MPINRDEAECKALKQLLLDAAAFLSLYVNASYM